MSFSSSGGAGSVARETNEILNKNEVVSSTYFLTESTLRKHPIKNVRYLPASLIDEFVLKRRTEMSMLSVVRSRSASIRLRSSADVIHFHWWQDFNLQQVARGHPNSKVVFSLHDDRAFTGGCHSAGICEQFEAGCLECPMVRNQFKSMISENFRKTRQDFEMFRDLHFIAPTEKIKKRAIRGGLGNIAKISIIPNPISNYFWGSFSEGSHIRSDVLTFGFIASNLSDRNKRLELAVRLVERIRQAGFDVRLITVGSSLPESLKTRVVNLGPLTSEQLAAQASSWNALILSSVYENSPVVIGEMASLGVPVITDENVNVAESLNTFGQKAIARDFENLFHVQGLQTLVDHVLSFDNEKRQNLRAVAERKIGTDLIFEKLMLAYSGEETA